MCTILRVQRWEEGGWERGRADRREKRRLDRWEEEWMGGRDERKGERMDEKEKELRIGKTEERTNDGREVSSCSLLFWKGHTQ